MKVWTLTGPTLGVEEEWMAKKTQEIRESFEKLQEMLRELDKEIAKISSTAVRVRSTSAHSNSTSGVGWRQRNSRALWACEQDPPSDVITQTLEDEHNLFETATLLRKVIPVVSVLEDTPHTRTGKAQIEALKVPKSRQSSQQSSPGRLTCATPRSCAAWRMR